MMCVLQESQAISLVSVAHVLGEVHPHRGFRRQPSHSDDLGPEKTDPGQKQQQFLNIYTDTLKYVCVVMFVCFLDAHFNRKVQPLRHVLLKRQ